MRKVKLGVVQMSCSKIVGKNIEKAEAMARMAAEQGANIILLPELFERQYFCQERRYDYYRFAAPVTESIAVRHFMKVAKELEAVIPVSFYEKDKNSLYNSVAVIDADGSLLGVYRKVHIPDDHFYQEKFYFTPGNLGFPVFNTRYGRVGVGICWDQWFPETTRSLALGGAEIIVYPTAIGSEPVLKCDSMPHWRRCIQGQSAANLVLTAVANRVGLETVEPSEENANQQSSLMFYGASFIANEKGELAAEAIGDEEEVLTAGFDLDEVAENRLSWGVFRDRRPECYSLISGK